jgi:hypothetical protein
MSTKAKEKIYARLDTERVVAECHLVRTQYEDGKHHITTVEPLTKFEINTEEDLKAGIVQMELEGKG